MSHWHCLSMAKRNNWPHVLIVEDDILFLDKPKTWDQINRFFAQEKAAPWDVLLLGGNNITHVSPNCDFAVQINQCQTTTGYLVRAHYYDALMENIALGIRKFLQYPHKSHLYAIDKYWTYLQQRDNWFLLLPLIVTQYQNYSDIERRTVHYNKVLLNLNK
jgi:GR25 family glycosyltransferase involved in LPS biosynthesis